MRRSLAVNPSATEQLSSASPCGRTAKADLAPHTPACDMRGPAKEALRRTQKQETGAASAGISQSRLSHKLSDGTLTVKEMEAFGAEYLAELGKQLHEAFGPLSPTASGRLRQLYREIDEREQEARDLSLTLAEGV